MDRAKDSLGENSTKKDTYADEMANKGNSFLDTPEESAIRDQAKMDKALSGETQKMNGAATGADESDDRIAEEIKKETLDNK